MSETVTAHVVGTVHDVVAAVRRGGEDAKLLPYSTVNHLLTATVTAVILSTGTASAQSDGSSVTCPNDVPNQLRVLIELIIQIRNAAIVIGLAFASLMLVYAGFLWLRGTPEAQDKARRVFTNVVIGVVIILMASGFIEFIRDIICQSGG